MSHFWAQWSHLSCVCRHCWEFTVRSKKGKEQKKSFYCGSHWHISREFQHFKYCIHTFYSKWRKCQPISISTKTTTATCQNNLVIAMSVSLVSFDFFKFNLDCCLDEKGFPLIDNSEHAVVKQHWKAQWQWPQVDMPGYWHVDVILFTFSFQFPVQMNLIWNDCEIQTKPSQTVKRNVTCFSTSVVPSFF